LQFDWDSNGVAHSPQWQPLSDEDAATLTGDSLGALNGRLGDLELQEEEEAES
jgi:hypothetical protein